MDDGEVLRLGVLGVPNFYQGEDEEFFVIGGLIFENLGRLILVRLHKPTRGDKNGNVKLVKSTLIWRSNK